MINVCKCINIIAMNNQLQQKGLFTFYRQQQQLQDKFAQIKKQRESPKQNKNDQMNQSKRRTNNSPFKANTPALKEQQIIKIAKVESAFQAEQQSLKMPQTLKNKLFKQKQYGNSVIIIHRNKQIEEPKQHSQNQIDKIVPKGRYVQNKSIAFQSQTQQKTNNFISQRYNKPRKKIMLRKIEGPRNDVSSRIDMASVKQNVPTLPLLNRQESETQASPSTRSKLSGSALRFQGGQLLRQIRNSLKSQQNDLESKQMISYFQYKRDYLNQSNQRRDDLTAQQRKMLQLLEKYRKDRY